MKLTEFAANMSSLLSTILLILYVIVTYMNTFFAEQSVMKKIFQFKGDQIKKSQHLIRELRSKFFSYKNDMMLEKKAMAPRKLMETKRLMQKDYLQEEQLYYVLIDLMRSPEMIKNITKSSLIFIQDKNILQKEEKQKYVKNQPILEDFNAVVRNSFQK